MSPWIWIPLVVLLFDAWLGWFLITYGNRREARAKADMGMQRRGNCLDLSDHAVEWRPWRLKVPHAILATVLLPVTLAIVPLCFLLLIVPGINRLLGYLLCFLGGFKLLQGLYLTGHFAGMFGRDLSRAWDGIGDWRD